MDRSRVQSVDRLHRGVHRPRWVLCSGQHPGAGDEDRLGRARAAAPHGAQHLGAACHVEPQAAAFSAQHGRRQRVFCASLSAWLHNAVPIEWLADLLDLVRNTPNLDWLLLSKRIGTWRSRLEKVRAYALTRPDNGALHAWITKWLCGEAPANAWIGATIVDQSEADRDIPKLLMVPATVRFFSMEPLLGPVKLSMRTTHMEMVPGVHWVIVGGESGPRARPIPAAWA